MPEPNRASTSFATGTLTFLFADIEGSTRFWEETPERMHAALAIHDAIARDEVERHRGNVVKTSGDGMLAVYAEFRRGARRSVNPQVPGSSPGRGAKSDGFQFHVNSAADRGGNVDQCIE
jgi:Adenylate and Guanylate cyclase catalytic domain